MNRTTNGGRTVPRTTLVSACLAVFCLVAAAQFWMAASIGTDVPFLDQWVAEGRNLYPAYEDGAFPYRQVFAAHNEHRIVFTQLLNLGLFAANGAWDPLVQQFANVVLRAGCAALLAGVLVLAGGLSVLASVLLATIAYLPVVAWHNVIWGFQTHVPFSLGFAIAAMALLGRAGGSHLRCAAGVLCAGASMFSMGAGWLVPVALLAWCCIRCVELRKCTGPRFWRDAVVALALLVLALSVRHVESRHAGLAAHGLWEWATAFARVMAWPHCDVPLAGLAINLPFAGLVVRRLVRRGVTPAGEEAILLLGLWAAAVAAATTWSRGGSPEMVDGVPSRYVDFVVLMPVVNLWSLGRLSDEVPSRWKGYVRGAWWALSAFLLIGLLGLTMEAVRGLVLPRLADRAAPERLAYAYERTRNQELFRNQPRLYCPDVDFGTLDAVLDDARLSGKLPPSLQPERPLGPLSRVARWARQFKGWLVGALLVAAVAALALPRFRRSESSQAGG